MKNTAIAVLSIVIVALGLVMHSMHVRHQVEIATWREAARPVFQSRGNVDITNRATPRDLADYLDPAHAVDWRERADYLGYRIDLDTQRPYGAIRVHTDVIR